MTYPPPQPGEGGPTGQTPRVGQPNQQTPHPPAGQATPNVPPAAPEPSRSEPVQPVGIDERGRVRRGTFAEVWTAAIAAAVLLIALIIFIAQNSRQVAVHFLGLSGHISLALALLIASVGSVLLVAIPGSLRILQLRRALRKTASQLRGSA
jgi:uncharacterized integral membrane protein